MANRYFNDDTFLGRLFRFFNLLEPDRAVLSISKVFMWLMIVAAVFVIWKRPDDMASVIPILSGNLISIGNYAYRRHMHAKHGQVNDNERDSSTLGG